MAVGKSVNFRAIHFLISRSVILQERRKRAQERPEKKNICDSEQSWNRNIPKIICLLSDLQLDCPELFEFYLEMK